MGSNYPNGFNAVTIRGIPLLNLYPGKVFWVDSNGNPGYGTFERPCSTIVDAMTKTKTGRGDIIICKPGHVEAIVAAAQLAFTSMTQVCVYFLGEGASRATISFGTDVGADVDIDSAGITFVRPRFLSAIDALTGPIDVNAADFTIIDGLWADAAAMAVTDCIVATSAAIRLCIDGWRYIPSTTGTQKQSQIQLNGVDDVILKNIHVAGDFGTGIIENVTDEMLNVHMENLYLNNLSASPTPCIVIDANATGYAKNVKCRVASGSTYVSNVGKINWSNDCEGFNADGGAGDPIGTLISTGIEGLISTLTSKTDSVGVEGSLAVSRIASTGIQASTVQSKVDSAGIQVSTVQSKADSVGAQVSTVQSKADSVGIQASAAASQVASVGIQASTVQSKTDSVGITGSTSNSKVDSTAAAIASTMTSIGLIISLINSKT